MNTRFIQIFRLLVVCEIPMLWLIATVNFAIPRLMPGDPLLALQDPDNALFVSDGRVREQILRYYGLDRSVPDQYWTYLTGILRADLGWSTRFNASVVQIIGDRLPWTLALIVPALIISAFVAIWAGTESAWAQGTWRDTLIVTLFSAVRMIPVYVLAVVGIIVFGVLLGVAPLGGARTPFMRQELSMSVFLDLLHHWWLPALTLTLELIGARLLLVRNSVVAIRGEPYLRAAAAKGLDDRTIRYRHALPHAYLPFITGFATQAGMALGGSVFVESLFSYPGMGRLLIESVAARDYALIQGVFLTIAAGIVIANRIVDSLAPLIDPRLRSL